jgi:outer membrane protein OmpA-like peptidoglycan-associated protein
MIICLALLAALIWKTCGNSLPADGHEAGAGEKEHATEAITEAKHEAHTEMATAAAGKVDTATGDFIYDMGKMIMIDLPNNGGKLEVGENSTENKLIKFLSDKAAALDTVKGNWFELTNVRFRKGGISIDSSSLAQIKNIASICKAFPTAQFKIGGYTDNSGDSINNIILSQRRADAVFGEFKKAGVSNTAFTGAKGYGPEHPIGDNNTAEGKAMNRRVAVNVKAK